MAAIPIKKFLSVVVVRGMGLEPKDMGYDSKLRTSDPYCILRVVPHGSTKKTKAIRRNLNPVWNHRFSMGFFDVNSTLRITCWDKDLFTSDDLIGEVEIPLSTYVNTRESSVVEWFQIHDIVGHQAGRIQLKFIISAEKPKKSKDTVLSLSELPPIEVKKKLVFGVEIAKALENQKKDHPDLKLPYVVHECIRILKNNHLNSEGIFRKGGAYALLQSLVKKIDDGESICLDSVPVDTVTEILKQYFRLLPTPLLTYKVFKGIVDAPNEVDDNWLSDLQLLIAEIPKINFELALQLFDLLSQVVLHSDENKMTPKSLGTCIGPAMLWEPPEAPIPLSQISSVHEKVNSIVAIMIEQHTFFFDPRVAGVAKSPTEQREALSMSTGRHMFYMYDTSRNGALDKEEFSCFYRDLVGASASEEEILACMAVIEKTDEEIDMESFLAWWKSSGKYKTTNLRASSYTLSHSKSSTTVM